VYNIPESCADKAVWWFPGIVRVIAKPGPADGDAAPDGLLREKETFSTEPDERFLPVWLKMADMGSLQKDLCRCQRVTDLCRNQPAAVLFKRENARNCMAAV
jgi:hypothetical protein